MWRLIDEIAGTAYMGFCLVWTLTHLSEFTQAAPAPLWLILLVFGIGILGGMWGSSRTDRLISRIRHYRMRRTQWAALRTLQRIQRERLDA